MPIHVGYASFFGTRGMRSRVIDPEYMRAAFRSPGWQESLDVLQTALGLRLAVVDLATGETLTGAEPMTLCQEGRVPGVPCLVRTEREIDLRDPMPVRTVCDEGLPGILLPVHVDGEIVCHVFLYGYLSSAKEADRVLQRAMAAGRTELEARAAIEGLTLLERARLDAAGALVVSRIEQLLTEQHDEIRRVGRHLEVSLLADVARDLGPDGLVYDRIPATSLSTLLRLTGASAGRIALVHAGADLPESVADVGESDRYLPPVATDDIARQVLESGRTMVVTGTDDAGRKTSTMTVPLGRRAARAGVLSVVKTGQATLAADDVRLVELFAEVVSAMLDNAQDFFDANLRLVEMIQVSEVAKALNSTLDYDRLAELAVQVLSKTLDFGIGGFVIEGFGSTKGRVVHTVDVARVDIALVVSEATGTEPGTELSEVVEIASLGADLSPDPTAVPREWTVVARDLHFRNIRAGSLFVASADAGAFHEADERVLESLATHLSVALENATLYDRLRTDFIRAMAAISAMADATERLESGHTDRVMDYAIALGQAMGLSLERLGLLRFAGLLHDLGKIGVAEEILIKPTALTPEEMERVRRHSEMGASIVEQIRTLEEITPIVRHHHEHFDGTGYPDELAGEDIPLEARILAVADAYEAMTGARTHRKRMAPATARAELVRASGSQFDPAVVEAFIGVLEIRALGGATGVYGLAASGPQLPA
jgi:HD-GYP domain-containing protein (c-di-GMP phosphodiesterase class II)